MARRMEMNDVIIAMEAIDLVDPENYISLVDDPQIDFETYSWSERAGKENNLHQDKSRSDSNSCLCASCVEVLRPKR